MTSLRVSAIYVTLKESFCDSTDVEGVLWNLKNDDVILHGFSLRKLYLLLGSCKFSF